MTDAEIQDKAQALATRIRDRIAMNEEDKKWLQFQIWWTLSEIKNKQQS